MSTAILLIAHGSRNPQANQDLVHVAAAMVQRGHAIVEVSFLESAEPGIEAGAARCVTLGVDRVVMLPYFLSAGVHVSRDLAGARELLSARFPDVEFRLAEPLGRHPLLIDVLEERVREAAD